MNTQITKLPRPEMISALVDILKKDDTHEVEEDRTVYIFHDLLQGTDFYEVILHDYECGADPEVEVIHNDRNMVYEGSFQGDPKVQALTKVAEHMADQIINFNKRLGEYFDLVKEIQASAHPV